MKRILAFAFIVVLAACQEHIDPVTPPNNSGGGSTPPPSDPVSGKYANCLSLLSSATLDVVTWNIENFPKGSNTVTLLKEIISTMDPDIIAVQEIASQTNFNLLLTNLPGYQGVITSSGTQRLGFIYKPEEIISFEPVTELFTDDACAFPRAPLKTKIKHVSGREVVLIDVHLKCCEDVSASCGSAITRRKNAATKIKNYIDQNLSSASVIVLGDYNEDITQPEGNDVLTNFVNDGANYRFADMAIAEGSSSNWSYPGFPSHLDHMLITNELFDNVQEVRTLKLSGCESTYLNSVSDHYPVMMRLKNLN